MQVVIDIGNTSTKVGFFIDGELKNHFAIDGLISQKEFKKLISKRIVERVIVSSVIPKSKSFERYLEKTFHCLNMAVSGTRNSTSPNFIQLPFKNLYKTPQTLGHDRIANAAAAAVLFKGKNTLVIDVGTCLKFDVVDKKGNYRGGSISPGIHMRYRALHYFTGKLPLIEIKTFRKLIGTSTEESITAGVQNGMYYEIAAAIMAYQNQYDQLNIILTGGDWRLFAQRLKKFIFADPFFTLKGLQLILENNIENPDA